MKNQFEKFYKAQNRHYRVAKKEIEKGRKESHWIWYIFPQLSTLGHSYNAQYYGIQDINEACVYLKDAILFKLYCELVALVEKQLNDNILLKTLFNGHPDDYKFISSLTLFSQAAAKLAKNNASYLTLHQSCGRIFKIVQKQGYEPCQLTLNALN